MECDRIQDRIVDHLTEETRPTERLCVEVHLATCYRCREAMDEIRTVLKDAQGAMRFPGTLRTFESTMAAIEAKEAARSAVIGSRHVASRYRWLRVAIAAGIPLLIAGATPFVIQGARHATMSHDSAGSAPIMQRQLVLDEQLGDAYGTPQHGRFAGTIALP